LENGNSATTLIFDFSRDTTTLVPRTPALPPTLILSLRNFSNSAVLRTSSSTGALQSMVNLTVLAFLPTFLV
jgi:hypothetical protein